MRIEHVGSTAVPGPAAKPIIDVLVTVWITEYRANPADTFHRYIDTAHGCISIGQTEQFWVTYQNTSGLENLNIDSTNVSNTPFDIYSAWSGHTPFEPEFSGETKYVGSDMPGTPTQTVVGSTLLVQQFNDAFTASLPTFVNICHWPQRYARSGILSNAMSFFTYANEATNAALNC
jgi:GrpB protein